MANMIDNQLEVRGPEAKVAEFVRKTMDSGEPDLLGACMDPGDPAMGLLGLQHSKKLEPGLYDIEGESRHLYYFRTKWQPPIELIDRLSKWYPDLHFALHYYDLNGSCYGDFEVRNGIVRLQNNRTLDEITAYEQRRIDGSMNQP